MLCCASSISVSEMQNFIAKQMSDGSINGLLTADSAPPPMSYRDYAGLATIRQILSIHYRPNE